MQWLKLLAAVANEEWDAKKRIKTELHLVASFSKLNNREGTRVCALDLHYGSYNV